MFLALATFCGYFIPRCFLTLSHFPMAAAYGNGSSKFKALEPETSAGHAAALSFCAEGSGGAAMHALEGLQRGSKWKGG
eukprot:1162092-Pelagomonas_calceolata.AAC.11